jgi:hypothetical protein
MSNFTNLNKVSRNVLEKYDITGFFGQHLNQLKGLKIICICDDSTSMRETLSKGQSKWDELKQSIEIVLDIASAYEVECDVLFLNRPGFRKVTNISQLNGKFESLPQGCTPLTKCFNLALENNTAELDERKLLVIIFTDGCPTVDNVLQQKDAIGEFKQALQNRNPMDRIFVTIVACTDDEYSLRYLNNWDNTIRNLDVVDDYESERKEIYAAGKVNTASTYGDYIAKILLGSFVKEIDELDEEKEFWNDIPESIKILFFCVFFLILYFVFFKQAFNKIID